MSGENLYYDLASILTDAGLVVHVSDVNAGWETRARSSGGFPQRPLGCWWHHTASSTTPASDLAWMIDNCDDAPVGNLLIDRDGNCWPIAGGASNCAGRGGPSTFSRGTCPLDQGNVHGFQLEVANDGVGEAWPQVQVDAFFRASNALNAHVGNLPTDVITHQAYAPSRKIDPAVASSVAGPWQPTAVTSSGTWSVPDIATECSRRAQPEGDEMTDEERAMLQDTNSKVLDLWYMMMQLVREDGWPNLPAYRDSMEHVVRGES